MKKRNRNILIVVLSVFIVLGGFAVYGVYRLYSFFTWMSSMKPETPAEIKEARVLTGSDLLTKSEFFKLDESGMLDTIGKGMGIEDEEERQKFIHMQTAKGIYNFSDLKVVGYEIVAVGEFGAYIFELNGTPKRYVAFDLVKEKIKIGPYEKDTFQSNLDNLRIVQLETNKYGFLSYGSRQGVQVFDQDGHQIWGYGKEDIDLGSIPRNEEERKQRYEKSTRVLEAAVGDLDNDGISEYVVARKKDGIHAFDRQGKEKWFTPDDFPSNHLEVMDIDGDGKNELVALGKDARDGDGKLLRNLKSVSDNFFLFVDPKKKTTMLQSCAIFQENLTCIDEDGDSVLKAKAPLSTIKLDKPREVELGTGPNSEDSITFETENSSQVKATWVALQKDKPKYLAVIAAFIGIPRANLYIYAPDGTLVYHELLPENAETIAVLTGENGIEALLVGGKDTIWKYTG